MIYSFLAVLPAPFPIAMTVLLRIRTMVKGNLQRTENEALKRRIAIFLNALMVRGPLTHRSLADLLGISSGRLSAYTKGRELPRLDLVLRLAEVGNVTLDQLLKEGLEPKVYEGFHRIFDELAGRKTKGTVGDPMMSEQVDR